MVSLLLAAAAANMPAQPHVAAAIPATATVRIARAAELRGDRLEATEESLLRKTPVRESDGSSTTASLVEYL